MPLDVTTEQIDLTTTIVTLNGRLALGTLLTTAETNITDLIDAGVRILIVDLSAVPYVDSEGLGTLVLLTGKLKAKGGQLRILAPNTVLTDLFKMTHTDKLLNIFSDRASALK
jgi:anti-sigma B factor antagonist